MGGSESDGARLSRCAPFGNAVCAGLSAVHLELGIFPLALFLRRTQLRILFFYDIVIIGDASTPRSANVPPINGVLWTIAIEENSTRVFCVVVRIVGVGGDDGCVCNACAWMFRVTSVGEVQLLFAVGKLPRRTGYGAWRDWVGFTLSVQLPRWSRDLRLSDC